MRDISNFVSKTVIQEDTTSQKGETLTRCWYTVGTTSTTLAQHHTNTGSTPCLLQCWYGVGSPSTTLANVAPTLGERFIFAGMCDEPLLIEFVVVMVQEGVVRTCSAVSDYCVTSTSTSISVKIWQPPGAAFSHEIKILSYLVTGVRIFFRDRRKFYDKKRCRNNKYTNKS